MRSYPRLSGLNRVLLGLLLFSGVTALITGTLLIAFPQGGSLLPLSLLENTRVHSFLLPGVLLVGVIATIHLSAAIAIVRRAPRADWLTAAAGVAMCAWVLIQVAVMNKWYWIQPVFLIIGVLTFELTMAWFAQEDREVATV